MIAHQSIVHLCSHQNTIPSNRHVTLLSPGHHCRTIMENHLPSDWTKQNCTQTRGLLSLQISGGHYTMTYSLIVLSVDWHKIPTVPPRKAIVTACLQNTDTYNPTSITYECLVTSWLEKQKKRWILTISHNIIIKYLCQKTKQQYITEEQLYKSRSTRYAKHKSRQDQKKKNV